MINKTVIEDRHMHKHLCCTKCISWTAIFAGALVGIGLNFLLNVFGLSIGLTAFTSTQEGVFAVAVGGYFAILLGSIVSMYVAGWVTGYVGRVHSICRRHIGVGILYGFITWCLALIITVLLTTHVNQFISYHKEALMTPSAHSIVLNTTTNDNAPVVSQQTLTDKVNNTSTTHVVVNPEKAANAIGTSLFLTFFVFFAGALASCFGGYFGLKHRAELCDSHESDVPPRL